MSAARSCRGPQTAALAFALLAGASRLTLAQNPATGAAAAVHYESYGFASPATVGAKSVSLITLPFAARVVVAPALRVEAAGAMARGTVVDQTGSGSTLSGLTDTELRATLTLQRERSSLALAALALVPSGHARLAPAEAIVAGAIASDLLPFHISNWGSGGGGALEVSAVQAMEYGSFGVAASYRIAGSFQPLDGLDARYRPGGELRFRLGLERTLERDRTLALQLSYSSYGEDRWNGGGLLHSGQRMLALGSYALPVGNAVGTAYGGVLYRSGGALVDAVLRAGVLSSMVAPPSETLLLLGSSARIPWHRRLLVPGVDFRLLRRADGTGQGLLFGIGGSAELPAGDGGVRIVPSARLRAGKLLVTQGAESAVRGFEVGLGLSFGGAR